MDDPKRHRGIEEFKKRLLVAVRKVVKDEQAVIEKAISIPVVRDFAGNVVQRSKPGEPPRLEEGQLHANVDSSVTMRPSLIHGTIESSRPETPEVPLILEEMGSAALNIEPRPYMRPAADRLMASAIERIVAAFK